MYPVFRACFHERSEGEGEVLTAVRIQIPFSTHGIRLRGLTTPYFRGTAMSRGFYIVRTGSLHQTAMDPENSLQKIASSSTEPEDFHYVSGPLHLLARQLDAYTDGARYASTEAPRSCTLTLSWY